MFGVSAIGRRTGEAIVVLQDAEYAQLALKRHHHYLNQRYIEVCECILCLGGCCAHICSLSVYSLCLVVWWVCIFYVFEHVSCVRICSVYCMCICSVCVCVSSCVGVSV